MVFPFFGPNPDERVGTIADCPQHGFARTSTWAIADLSVTSEGGCKAVFQLQDSEATRRIWPFAFKLSYEVVLGVEIKFYGAFFLHAIDAPPG